jgi:hypothetical protein
LLVVARAAEVAEMARRDWAHKDLRVVGRLRAVMAQTKVAMVVAAVVAAAVIPAAPVDRW